MNTDEIIEALGLPDGSSYATAHDRVKELLREAERTGADDAQCRSLYDWEYQLGYSRNKAAEFSFRLDVYDASPRSIDISLTADPIDLGEITAPFWATVLGWTDNDREAVFRRQGVLMDVLAAAEIGYATGWATATNRERPCLVSFEVEAVQRLGVDQDRQDVVVEVTNEFQQLRPYAGRPIPIRGLRFVSGLRCPEDPRIHWEAEKADAIRVAQAKEAKRQANEAKRKAIREQAKLIRAATAAEHKRLTGQGWPSKWSPANVQTWTELGGTLDSAKRGVAGGWTFDALCDGFGLGPSGNADGRLPELGIADTPLTGVGVALRLTRRTPRKERVLEVLKSPDGWLLADADTLTSVDAPSLEGVIRVCAELYRLPLGEQVSFRCPSETLRLEALVPCLRVSGTKTSEGPAWTDDKFAEHWLQDDEDLEDVLGNEVTFVQRWATFNGIRLTGIRVGSTVDVVAVDVNEQQLIPLEVLAEGSWFSDSVGAPISWDGGSQLARISARLAMMIRTWGDIDPGTSCFRLPRAQTKFVALVAEWVTDQDFEGAVAFGLEPFDPKGTLSASARAEWENHLRWIDPGRVDRLNARSNPPASGTSSTIRHLPADRLSARIAARSLRSLAQGSAGRGQRDWEYGVCHVFLRTCPARLVEKRQIGWGGDNSMRPPATEFHGFPGGSDW